MPKTSVKATAKKGAVDININANISNGQQSNNIVQSINAVEQQLRDMQSQQQQNAQQTDVNKKATSKKSTTNEILLRIAQTLDNLSASMNSSNARSTTPAIKPMQGVSSENITKALIESYVTKEFSRGMAEALRGWTINSETLSNIKKQLEEVISSSGYTSSDASSANGGSSTITTTPTGEEVTHTDHTVSAVLSPEAAQALLNVLNGLESSSNSIKDMTDAINGVTEVSKEVNANLIAQLNTKSGDAQVQDINSSAQNMQSETQTNNETAAETNAVDQYIIKEITPSSTITVGEGTAPEIERDDRGQEIQKVFVAELANDLSINDVDLAKILQEDHDFFNNLQKDSKDALSIASEISQKMDNVNASILESIPQTTASTPLIDAIRSLTEESSEPAEETEKKEENIDDIPLIEQNRIINDSMNPYEGAIVRQNDRLVTASDQSSQIEVDSQNSGITGAGVGESAIDSTKRSDKDRMQPTIGDQRTSGLSRIVSDIRGVARAGLLLMTQIYDYLPSLKSTRSVTTNSETNRSIEERSTNAIRVAPVPVAVETTQMPIAQQVPPNNRPNRLMSSMDDIELIDNVTTNNKTKVTTMSAVTGMDPNATKPLLDVLNEISTELKGARADAKENAAQAANAARYRAQFGNVRSGSGATPTKNDSLGFLRSLSRMLGNLKDRTTETLLSTRTRMWLFLIGIVGMVASFIWLLVKFPGLREKLVNWMKGVGNTLYTLWTSFWAAASPRVRAIALTIASLIGLMIFGPWGLLVGAALAIVGLWPKYKAWIIAIGVAIVAAFAVYWGIWLAATLGPIGAIIVAVIAIGAIVTALFIKFKDQIMNGVRAAGNFLLEAVKWLFTWPVTMLQGFFPGLGDKLKDAMVSLFGGIPFVGKYVKKMFGKSEEGEPTGENEAKAAAIEGKQLEEAFIKSAGKNDVGESAPTIRPEATSPITSYNAPAINTMSLAQTATSQTNIVENQEATTVMPRIAPAQVPEAAQSQSSGIIDKLSDLISQKADESSQFLKQIIEKIPKRANTSFLSSALSGLKVIFGSGVTAIMRVAQSSRSAAGSLLTGLSRLTTIGFDVQGINNKVDGILTPVTIGFNDLKDNIGTQLQGINTKLGAMLKVKAIEDASEAVGNAFRRLLGRPAQQRQENITAEPTTSSTTMVKPAENQVNLKTIDERPYSREDMMYYLSRRVSVGVLIPNKGETRENYEDRLSGVNRVISSFKPSRRNKPLKNYYEDNNSEAWNMDDIEIDVNAIKTGHEKIMHASEEQRETLEKLQKEYEESKETNIESIDVKQQTPNITPTSPESSVNSTSIIDLSANTTNSENLIIKKNEVEELALKNLNAKMERNEMEQTEAENKSAEQMNMLPNIIAVGLAKYFNDKEFKVKGGEQPSLAIEKDDKASAF